MILFKSKYTTRSTAMLAVTALLLTLNSFSVSAQGFETVVPTELNLSLAQGEATVEQVSLTIHPLCIRPYDVDVVASIPEALVANTTGVLLNGCGGDTSVFNISIMGTGMAQSFDLQFVDVDFGGVLATIPVTITPPATAGCSIDLSLGYRADTLFISLGLRTLEPANFNLFISAYNQTFPLLPAPVPLPVIDPEQVFVSSIPAFPDIDTFGMLATITTADEGILCSAWETVDSSPGS